MSLARGVGGRVSANLRPLRRNRLLPTLPTAVTVLVGLDARVGQEQIQS